MVKNFVYFSLMKLCMRHPVHMIIDWYFFKWVQLSFTMILCNNLCSCIVFYKILNLDNNILRSLAIFCARALRKALSSQSFKIGAFEKNMSYGKSKSSWNLHKSFIIWSQRPNPIFLSFWVVCCIRLIRYCVCRFEIVFNFLSLPQSHCWNFRKKRTNFTWPNLIV